MVVSYSHLAQWQNARSLFGGRGFESFGCDFYVFTFKLFTLWPRDLERFLAPALNAGTVPPQQLTTSELFQVTEAAPEC